MFCQFNWEGAASWAALGRCFGHPVPVGEIRDLGAARSRRRPALLDQQVVVPAERQAARLARRWVTSTLAEAEVVGYPNQIAELLTAELVAQALLRSTPQIVVRVIVHHDKARVEVTDESDTDGPTGTVAALVGAMSQSWGAVAAASGIGITTWFEVAVDW